MNRPAQLSLNRNHGLDTLRSVAILAVITFHICAFHSDGVLQPFLDPIGRFGWMGVDLFFVLSGYLIGTQLLRPYAGGHAPNLWMFYLRRFLRVLPAYLAVLALYYFLPVWSESPNLPPLWEFLTFTQNLFVHYPAQNAFSHVWSLCVEEHFYLLLPLVALLMTRRPSLAKTATLLGSLVLFGICIRVFFLVHTLRPVAASGRYFMPEYIERIYYPTYSRLDGLLAGVTLALIRIFRPSWWSTLARHGHLLFFAGVSVWGVAVWILRVRADSVYGLSAFGDAFGFPILSLALGLIVASTMSNNGILSKVHVPGARTIATLAYSLYLTHKEVMHLDDLLFPRIAVIGGLAWIALYAVSCLLVSATLYFCVERPFLLLRDTLLKSRDRSPELESAAEPAI